MAKRKREVTDDVVKTNKQQPQQQPSSPAVKKSASSPSSSSASSSAPITLQIITGSYERVLHGITATIPQLSTNENTTENSSASSEVKFSDTFLFSAHASAIRCIALSPITTSDPSQKVLLASGGTDERINLYHLSATPPPSSKKGAVSIPTLAGTTITENPKNRELGSLMHHSSSISALYFPSRSKLLSAAEDSTIAISRSRDWTVLSTIKAPVPKPQGRPSGDTAGPGEIPAGINDFSVHPSMKLMVSVSKGERCMRLWNLVTGKKAGVLNFTREMLQEAGEGRWSSGEGRKVEWDAAGEEFVVSFERGAIVFGMDSKPKGRIMPQPPSKIHQIRYVSTEGATTEGEKAEDEQPNNILAVSTEDGRIIFYSTSTLLPLSESANTTTTTAPSTANKPAPTIPLCKPLAQLGGRAAGVSSRIKDFEILSLSQSSDAGAGAADTQFLVVTASSTGAVQLWYLPLSDLDPELDIGADASTEAEAEAESKSKSKSKKSKKSKTSKDANADADADVNESDIRAPTTPSSTTTATPASTGIKQVGHPLGVYDTGNRITCLRAFVMLAPQPGAPDNDEESLEASEDESSDDDDDE
ncbi:hypothetical protein L228DRAFT_259793 [Xylona heveae TC161]|uniref:WD40 repeat-like protein n=1 Tax=Xylona heveae (strain CBS 132557 / TC161) TaxID=1328760 RepID=A0A161TQI4_XYLHT|nr:hypothetical protein L228DRAFT_259793 [Xylona heveae TC161]KZF24596.1 hypothetical protein L228DRAFT_259793 [Xylona heveae TC161]